MLLESWQRSSQRNATTFVMQSTSIYSVKRPSLSKTIPQKSSTFWGVTLEGSIAASNPSGL